MSFVIGLVISFFFTPYLIRTVGKEAYGFFPLVNSIIGYTSIITVAVGSMAGRFITMRFYDDDIEGANKYLNSVWVAYVFLAALFLIFGILGVVFIDKILTVPEYLVEEVKWLVVCCVFSLVLGMLTGFLGMGTYIKNRVDLSSSRDVVCNLVRVGSIFVLFAIFQPSIVFMSLSAVFSALVALYLNMGLKRRLIPELTLNPRKYFSFAKVKELTMSGIWNSLNSLGNILILQLDLLITNIFIGAAATGDYALVKTAPSMIYGLLAMLAGTFVPQFNILYAKNRIDELISEVRKSMIIVSLIIGLPIGFLLVFSDCFFNLWVPGQNTEVLYWMTVFTLLPMIFGGSVNPVFGIYSSTNKLKVPTIVYVLCGVLNIAVIYVLLKTTDLGIWAIIIVGAIQGGLRNAIFSPAYGAICLKKKWTAFYPTMFRGILAMLVVVGVSLVVKKYIVADTWISFFEAGLVVCAISVVLNCFIIMTKTERMKLFSIARTKLKLQLNR